MDLGYRYDDHPERSEPQPVIVVAAGATGDAGPASWTSPDLDGRDGEPCDLESYPRSG